MILSCFIIYIIYILVLIGNVQYKISWYRKLEMYDMQAWVLNKMLYSEKTIFRIFY